MNRLAILTCEKFVKIRRDNQSAARSSRISRSIPVARNSRIGRSIPVARSSRISRSILVTHNFELVQSQLCEAYEVTSRDSVRK